MMTFGRIYRYSQRMFAVALTVWLALGTASARSADEDAGYRQVTGPCGLVFPRDHGAHPEFRTEWWYYTGNLITEQGRPFGFQLTFFRHRPAPPGTAAHRPRPSSAWRSEQIFLAHAAVSDIAGHRHLQAGKTSREALGMAGWEQAGQETRVFVHDWRAVILPDGHRLEVAAGDFSFSLALVPAKAPVRHGVDGYSRKGAAPQRASCYYSMTRLETTGTLTLAEQAPLTVEGLGWMDHEFSTAPLAPETVGWDWFSIQLDDGREIMLFRLRRKDGSIDPASSGTFVDARGLARHIAFGHFDVAVRDTWRSPLSGAVYPVAWRVTIPEAGINVDVTASLPDQEMRPDDLTGITYWEGSVAVRGTGSTGAVQGRGYVELTGYAGPFEALK